MTVSRCETVLTVSPRLCIGIAVLPISKRCSATSISLTNRGEYRENRELGTRVPVTRSTSLEQFP